MSVQFLLVILAMARITISQVNEKQCRFQDTCERCLSANYNCTWCTDKTYEIRYRCLTRDELIMYGCAPEHIWANEQKTSIVNAAELQDYQNESTRARQLHPQLIKMKLVKSQTQQIKLTYRPARNNPLDLYYLMDLTWTMRDDKMTLVKMGAQLSEALRNLTDSYRIGFGSFADKPAMPMIMPQLRENPCAAEHQTCETTYGFKHHLQLTKDIDHFVQSVNDSRITGNLDNLEGALDALMQVIVCSEKIGWKEEARKIVLLVTDGFMHFAGDGILAGINLQNDRQCHLDETGEYTGSLVYDYPSLEEIYRELLRRKISVIFAVTPDVIATYQQISSLMNEISNVEKLTLDSSNILELIKTSYETFLKRAKFIDDSPPFINLSYETDCGGQFNKRRQRNYCNDLEIGKEVDFYINVTLKNFPDDEVYHRTIRIEEPGLSEYLELEIEIQKPCPCEEEAVTDEYGRFRCNGNGVLKCGMCLCDESWGGIFCSCNLNNVTTTLSFEKECQQPFSNPVELGPMCSNRGECECGICYCFPGYAGKYCECPECEDCDPEKADCFCGRCVCKYGWSGNGCNCKASVEGCKAPNGEVCSERGECQCGDCICKEQYVGRFCEIGWKNDNKLCEYYESCVKCLIQQKLGTYYCENITDLCISTDGEMFGYTFVTEDIAADIRCVVRLIDDNEIKCDHFYSYDIKTSSTNYLTIHVSTDCVPISAYVKGAFILLLTFLIGLISLLIFVFYIRRADAREYLKFEQQNKFDTLMESPIYKNPVMEYKVPKFEDDETSI